MGTDPDERPDDDQLDALKKAVGKPAEAIVDLVTNDEELTENAVVVEIRHDRLASPEESVMDYLANHAEITNRVARELTGIRSENTMKLVFLRLAKRNLIKRIPGREGASSAWQKYRQ